LECRIQNCWGLFTDGSFANALKRLEEDIATALKGEAKPEPGERWWKIFCELRGLLLLYLSKHPDKYNCTIEPDIRKIPFPQDRSYQTGTTSPTYDVGESREVRTHPGENYSEDVRLAFCRLFKFANQYVVSCIMGEMIFPCPESCEPSCIVLGTVEVVGDKVVHVCNCPRSYVFSFASFWEVIVATVLGGLACEETPKDRVAYGREMADPATPRSGADTYNNTAGRERTSDNQWTGTRYDPADECEDETRICCSPAKFICADFVQKLAAPETIYDGSTATLRMLSELKQSVRYALDFTRPEARSPNAFKGLYVKQAHVLANRMSVKLIVHEEPLPTLELDQVVRTNTLSGPEPTMHVFQSGGRIVDVKTEWREEGLLDPAERKEIDDKISQLQEQVRQLQDSLRKTEEMGKRLGHLRREVSEGIAESEKSATKKRPTRKRRPGTREEK
jgi:hypothetical protein